MSCISAKLQAGRLVPARRVTFNSRPGVRRTVLVKAIWGGRDEKSASEKVKQDQYEIQQARLAERRAKRMAQIAAGMSAKAPPKEDKKGGKAAAPAPPARKAKVEEVFVEEEEEAPAKPAGGNPLGGLFNMFGKK